MFRLGKRHIQLSGLFHSASRVYRKNNRKSEMAGKENHSNCDGYSLLEVMIGVFVFTIVAAGVASSTTLTSRMALSNIYRNTASTIVQGYAEQIKSIRYEVIAQALEDPTNRSIPTMSLSTADGKLSELNDPLYFGVRSKKNIVIDIEELPDGTERERIMELWVTPTGTDLAKSGDDLEAIEITLYYEWVLSDKSIQRSYDSTIKIVKTSISEY